MIEKREVRYKEFLQELVDLDYLQPQSKTVAAK
jgi:hypothetical protein